MAVKVPKNFGSYQGRQVTMPLTSSVWVCSEPSQKSSHHAVPDDDPVLNLGLSVKACLFDSCSRVVIKLSFPFFMTPSLSIPKNDIFNLSLFAGMFNFAKGLCRVSTSRQDKCDLCVNVWYVRIALLILNHLSSPILQHF